MAARTNPFGWPTWLRRCAMMPVLLFFAAGLFNNLAGIALFAGLLPVGGLGLTDRDVIERPGWSEVMQVEAAGPAAARDLLHPRVGSATGVR